jgi:LysR family transcriptional regulator, transcriptional activator of nhaA
MNYHHLRYFHAVARLGNMTKAAARLRVAQSAISLQIRRLEEAIGTPLFERDRKTLVLTEAGRIAVEYADTIFRTGDELVDVLKGRPAQRQVLRVGAVSTLSRNFQIAILRPILDHAELIIRTGGLRELLGQLRAHTLDLVLANQAVPRDEETPWHSHLLDRQEVCLVSRPVAGRRKLAFPRGLEGARLVLPGLDSNIRAGFDALLARAGVRPIIAAVADDMPMLRLLAREADALTLVPRVVVRDELEAGELVERCRIEGLTENFYAITAERRFPNRLAAEIVGKSAHGSGKRASE